MTSPHLLVQGQESDEQGREHDLGTKHMNQGVRTTYIISQCHELKNASGDCLKHPGVVYRIQASEVSLNRLAVTAVKCIAPRHDLATTAPQREGPRSPCHVGDGCDSTHVILAGGFTMYESCGARSKDRGGRVEFKVYICFHGFSCEPGEARLLLFPAKAGVPGVRP